MLELKIIAESVEDLQKQLQSLLAHAEPTVESPTEPAPTDVTPKTLSLPEFQSLVTDAVTHKDPGILRELLASHGYKKGTEVPEDKRMDFLNELRAKAQNG